MDEQRPPSDRVREVVASFLQASGLSPVVDVVHGRTLYGEEEMSLKPRAEGAADLVIRTAGDTRSYVIHVFVAGEDRPIEIAGPTNENTYPPFRSADEDLLEILHLAAMGQAFDEVDKDGNVLGSDVPDVRTATGSREETERRRWYKPWA